MPDLLRAFEIGSKTVRAGFACVGAFVDRAIKAPAEFASATRDAVEDGLDGSVPPTLPSSAPNVTQDRPHALDYAQFYEQHRKN